MKAKLTGSGLLLSLDAREFVKKSTGELFTFFTATIAGQDTLVVVDLEEPDFRALEAAGVGSKVDIVVEPGVYRNSPTFKLLRFDLSQ